MTSNNRRTALFALALGVSAAGGAHAQGFGRHGPHHPMFGLLEGVTLSDTQQQQVSADIQAGWQQTKATRHALRALEEQIAATLLSSGSVSSGSVMSLVQQEEALRSQLDAERVAVALKVRGVLTASQIAQAAAAHSQLEALHQQEQAIAHPDAPAQPE